MMRTTALTAVSLLAATLLAGAAHAFECAPGEYSGKTWSVTKPLSGHAATLTASEKDGRCVLRFKIPSAEVDEIWMIKENKLEQQEFDASGKETMSYGSTLGVRDGVEGYYIDCEGGSCDAGIDSRYFWRLSSSGEGIVYSVWGVAPDKQSDPKARAKKRHEYTFSKIK